MKPVSDKWIEEKLRWCVPISVSDKGVQGKTDRIARRALLELQRVREALREHHITVGNYSSDDQKLYRATLPEHQPKRPKCKKP